MHHSLLGVKEILIQSILAPKNGLLLVGFRVSKAGCLA